LHKRKLQKRKSGGDEVTNTAELKAQIVRNNDTQVKLAKHLHMSVSCLNQKINGNSDWRSDEIKMVADRYHLTDEEITAIFFN
jgi:hypothetical protein